MQEVPNFKIVNLKQPINLCNLDSNFFSKTLIIPNQNVKTKKMHQPTHKNITNLTAIFGKFENHFIYQNQSQTYCLNIQ